MIYPDSIESKLGVNEIRTLLKGHCISILGKELVDEMALSTNATDINKWLKQTKEFRRLQEEDNDFPIQYIYDLRQPLARLRIEGTHLETEELFDLRRTLDTICAIVNYLNRSKDDEDSQEGEKTYPYPTLHELTEDIVTFPQIVKRIDTILDKFGKIKDNASPELMRIRIELSKTEGIISKTLHSILHKAQSEGLVEKDVTPAIRDGRLVIPVTQGLKRKIKGIVHDESASGKTVFIEPTEVVEANNKIRELENDERREIIRILTDFANEIRPHINDLLSSYSFLAKIDFIKAKAEFAKSINAYEPHVTDRPRLDWIQAEHPLLQKTLAKQDKKVVPLDISLTCDKHILIISGPNAGGKSVCLKTVGLLQYMLQCGLSIPVKEHSSTGIFNNILIDIGAEQSIEDDLSTYSSHLTNMKHMMKQANDTTLLLIDEFGTGTEPQIGGAIAEAVLKQFCLKKAYGIITTHYQNLKHFADKHQGVANGAMLYDRHQMKALFKLSIGQPGSSFAIEIARKIGLPEIVIKDAGDIVGSDYIQSDKYLQDIVRDKRYWENKRRNIHLKENQRWIGVLQEQLIDQLTLTHPTAKLRLRATRCHLSELHLVVVIAKGDPSRLHDLTRLVELLADKLRLLHAARRRLTRLNQVLHAQLRMIVSRTLPILLNLRQALLRIVSRRGVHVRAGDLQASILRHLLELHHIDTTDLTLFVTS